MQDVINALAVATREAESLKAKVAELEAALQDIQTLTAEYNDLISTDVYQTATTALKG